MGIGSGSASGTVAVGSSLALSSQGSAALDDGIVHGAGSPSRCICVSVKAAT